MTTAARVTSYLAAGAFLACLVGATIAGETPWWIPALYVVASIASYGAYAADKAAARNGGWRVSEGTLLFLGLIGGWPGALVAQQRLRHKTVKPSFRFAFWVTVLLNISALVVISVPAMAQLFVQWLV